MTRAFLLLLLMPHCIVAAAQTMEWVVPVDLLYPPNGAFSSAAMAVDENGEVAIFGIDDNIIYYGSQRFGDLGFVTYDRFGQVGANVTFTGRGSIEKLVTYDGSYFALGQYLDSLDLTGHPQLLVTGQPNNVRGFLCRIEQNGSITWVKQLNEYGLDGTVSSMAVDVNGIMHVTVWDFNNSYVLGVDPDGELVSTWAMIGVGILSDVAVNADGLVAVAGSCLDTEVNLNGTDISAPNDYTIFAARFDSSGTLIDHTIVLDITCPSPSVVLDDANNLYFCGDVFREAEIGPFTLAPSPWVYSEFVARIDPVGMVQWIKQPNAGATLGDASRAYGQEMVLHPYGGVWQGGFARGSVDWGEGFEITSNIPGKTLYFLHINEQGATEQLITGDASDFTQSVHSIDTDGNDALYVMGFGYDTLHLGGVALAAQGYHLFLSRWQIIPTQVNEGPMELPLRIYPNPSGDQLRLDLVNSSGTAVVTIMDVQGRIVHTTISQPANARPIDISDLAAGHYTLHLSQGSVIRRGRFIKE